jgi:hypothetical protein
MKVVTMRKKAILSDDGRFRYTLERSWSGPEKTCLFIMLNPSTADHRADDATVRRCLGFAMRLGCNRLLIGNLFAYRSTDPHILKYLDDPIGPENDTHLRRLIEQADIRIVAWGGHGGLRGRDEQVLKMMERSQCLGRTKAGRPKHPLYAPYDSPLEDFQPIIANSNE